MEKTKETKKTNSSRRLYVLLALLLLCVGVYFMIPTKEHSHKLKDIDISKIEFETLVNPTNTTMKEIKSKPSVLMLFFTLNSKEVRENIQMLNKLHQHKNTSIIGYMLSGTKRAEKFAKNHNVQFPIVKPSKDLMMSFPTTKVPMLFLVDTKTLKAIGKFNNFNMDQIDMSLSVINEKANQ